LNAVDLERREYGYYRYYYGPGAAYYGEQTEPETAKQTSSSEPEQPSA
jgi:hypothetical protein